VPAQKKEARRYAEIRNSKAFHEYFVNERFEAGIKLLGTEVKSIRAGKAQIGGAFGRVEKGEVWLHNAHIDPYAFGNINNHDPRRPPLCRRGHRAPGKAVATPPARSRP